MNGTNEKKMLQGNVRNLKVGSWTYTRFFTGTLGMNIALKFLVCPSFFAQSITFYAPNHIVIEPSACLSAQG
jgi:hypothetical protein